MSPITNESFKTGYLISITVSKFMRDVSEEMRGGGLEVDHVHHTSNLRMTGATPPIQPYSFRAYRGLTLIWFRAMHYTTWKACTELQTAVFIHSIVSLMTGP